MSSSTFAEIGILGSLQRPSYDPTTGAPSGTVYSFKMGLAREQFAKQIDGLMVSQKFIALVPKKLAEAAGWLLGAPRKGDIIEIDGQRVIVEHTLLRGDASDTIWFCQTTG